MTQIYGTFGPDCRERAVLEAHVPRRDDRDADESVPL